MSRSRESLVGRRQESRASCHKKGCQGVPSAGSRAGPSSQAKSRSRPPSLTAWKKVLQAGARDSLPDVLAQVAEESRPKLANLAKDANRAPQLRTKHAHGAGETLCFTCGKDIALCLKEAANTLHSLSTCRSRSTGVGSGFDVRHSCSPCRCVDGCTCHSNTLALASLPGRRNRDYKGQMARLVSQTITEKALGGYCCQGCFSDIATELERPLLASGACRVTKPRARPLPHLRPDLVATACVCRCLPACVRAGRPPATGYTTGARFPCRTVLLGSASTAAAMFASCSSHTASSSSPLLENGP